MENQATGIREVYGGRIRVRVCGICVENDKILLVNHTGIGTDGDFWNPPGGGLELGETAEACLQREFLEETGIEVQVGRFMCVNEFIGLPLHSVELFFEATPVSGTLSLGTDPERETQVLKAVGWFSLAQLQQLPNTQLHNLLHGLKSLADLASLQGYQHFSPPHQLRSQ